MVFSTRFLLKSCFGRVPPIVEPLVWDLSFTVCASDVPVQEDEADLLTRVRRLEETAKNPEVEVHGFMVDQAQSLTVHDPPPENTNGSRGVFIFQRGVSIRRSANDHFFKKFFLPREMGRKHFSRSSSPLGPPMRRHSCPGKVWKLGGDKGKMELRVKSLQSFKPGFV